MATKPKTGADGTMSKPPMSMSQIANQSQSFQGANQSQSIVANDQTHRSKNLNKNIDETIQEENFEESA